MEKGKDFKICSCGASWKTYADVVGDKDMTIIGYQANLDVITKGFFLFNHEACKSTLAIGVTDFLPMYKGKIYPEKRVGTDKCKGLCLQRGNFSACLADCSYSYVREILIQLKNKV